ncbi:MAG: serine/threonine-protein phosphatase [Planctomycetales bacterium]|nr:serine/threonine-protein phosphatase [Planctomycetales bacterium]
MEYHALSDVGLRRASNQDAYAVHVATTDHAWAQRGHLFVVADGMGAHAAGELASKMAADTVPLTYEKLRSEPPPMALRHAIEKANDVINTRGEAHAEFHGMGTTVSTLVLLPQGAIVGHVGDSRVYRVRHHRLDQLTFDHSLVWEMSIGAGLREEDLPAYVPKNVITRSLGPSAQVQVDLEGPFPLAAGDVFMLCSDGLSGQVKDEEIGVILDVLSAREAAAALVDLANLRGGPDNITTIVVRAGEAETTASVVPDWGSEAMPTSGRRSTASWSWSRGLSAGGAIAGAAATLACLVAGQLVAAAVCGLATVGLGLRLVLGVATREGQSDTAEPDEEIPHGALGRGPYRSYKCEASAEMAVSLSRVVQQLRDAAVEETWRIDWDAFSRLNDAATAALGKKKYRQAIRDFCRAMSFMMNELRHQNESASPQRSTSSDDATS